MVRSFLKLSRFVFLFCTWACLIVCNVVDILEENVELGNLIPGEFCNQEGKSSFLELGGKCRNFWKIGTSNRQEYELSFWYTELNNVKDISHWMEVSMAFLVNVALFCGLDVYVYTAAVAVVFPLFRWVAISRFTSSE